MPQLKVQNQYRTSLTSAGGIAASGDVTFTVGIAPTYSNGYIVVSPDLATQREIMYFHTATSTTISVRAENRGLGGTTSKAHSQNEVIQMNDVAEIFNTFSDMIPQVFYVEKTGGLTIKVWGGYVTYNGNPQLIADTTLTLTNNTTNYIKYDFTTNSITADTINSGNIKAVVIIVSSAINSISYRNSKESYIDRTTDADFYKYSIIRTVTSGNLTVALKNYEGNDPTPTKPVKIMIGGVVRTITSALSFTNVAGFNWLNMGSNELATKETDIFVYLVWRSGENTVRLTSARFPNATIYNDFNSDATNEKGNLGNFASPVSSDPVVNIGRFNTILSAGGAYTWSIPSTSVIENNPVFVTRTIQGGSQTGWTANNLLFYYTINGDRVDFSFDANGTSNSTTSSITLPFSAKAVMAHDFALGLTYDNGAELTTPGRADLYTNTISLYKNSAYGVWTASGSKIIRGQGHYFI